MSLSVAATDEYLHLVNVTDHGLTTKDLCRSRLKKFGELTIMHSALLDLAVTEELIFLRMGGKYSWNTNFETLDKI